jgi:RNase P protein component
MVLVARNRAADADFEKIGRDLSYLLKKSGMIGE